MLSQPSIPLAIHKPTLQHIHSCIATCETLFSHSVCTVFSSGVDQEHKAACQDELHVA